MAMEMELLLGLVLLLALVLGALTWLLAYPWQRSQVDFSGTENLLSGQLTPLTRWQWSRFLPKDQSQLGRDLSLSGLSYTMEQLYRMKAGYLLGGLALGGFVFTTLDATLGSILLAAGCMAWTLPNTQVTGAAKRVRQEIGLRLPAFLQALAMMTEAGMNLQPAILTYLEREQSAFGRELRRAMDETKLGLPLAEALLRMVARCEVDDLYRAIAALIQASDRGASGLSDTCRQLASEAWSKRRDAAREIGQQISTKMFIPLMLLVLPTTLLFMLGPAVWDMIHNF